MSPENQANIYSNKTKPENVSKRTTGADWYYMLDQPNAFIFI